MHLDPQLPSLALVIVAALAAGMIFNRMRQPALVGYLLTGIALGPSGFAVVDSRENIDFLADLGILLLLFVVGMELSLRGFRAVWKVALAAALFQICVATGIMWAMSNIFGWTPAAAIVFGFVTALSSTAVAVKLLEDLNLLRTKVGQLTIGILIAQDLAIIPMILVMSMMAGGGNVTYVESAVQMLASVAVLVVLVMYLSRRQKVSLPFSASLAKSPELRPLYGTAACFGAAGVTGLLGLSTVYGAFLAGLVVGNSRSRRVIFRSIQPLQNLLIMVFFLSVGLLIDMNFVAENIGKVLLIVLFVTVGKTFLNIFILLILREPWPHAFIASLLIAQVGEFSFLLGAFAEHAKVVSPEEFQLIIAVTAFTLIISPIWLATARRVLRLAVVRVTNISDALDKLRSGGFAGFWRAARDRPLPQRLAFRVFGRPQHPETENPNSVDPNP